MINKNIADRVFKIAFILFITVNLAEWNIPELSSLDIIPFFDFSGIPFLKFPAVLFFALLIIPLKEFISTMKDRKFLILIIPIILLLTAGYISASLSEFSGKAFNVINRISFYFVIFLICYTAAGYFQNTGVFILKSFIFVNAIVIIISILEFYIPAVYGILVKYFNRPELIHSYIEINGEKIMRPMGILTDSNLTAFSTGLALMILLLNYRHFNKYFRYSYYIASSFVSGMLISRASLIMCIICLAVFILFKLAEKREMILFISIFIVFQIVTPQTYGRIFSYFKDEKIKEEFSAGRPVIWKAAFTVFRENPVTGVGPGVFFEISDKYIRDILKENKNLNIDNPSGENYHQIDKLNPHNIFLVVLSETGISGFIFFMILILFLLRGYIKDKKYISLMFFLCILFVSSLSNFAPYYKFYLIICIVFYIISDFNIRINQNVPKITSHAR
jgi:O-antigen ligase